MQEDGEMKVALAFRIQFHEPKDIVIDWLRGTDADLWESFTGLVHRNFRKVERKSERQG